MGMGREMDLGSTVVANLLRAWNGRRQGPASNMHRKAGGVPFGEGTLPAS